MNFLFVFYFIGLLIVVFQDIKRREIDDWLNLFLFFSGIGFLFFSKELVFSHISIVMFGFFIFIMCLLSLVFYYSRFFSGGDAKLFFAIAPLLYDIMFNEALNNIFVFVTCLVLCGSVYSLIYAIFLFFRDFEKIKRIFVAEFRKTYLRVLSMLGIIFIFMMFVDRIFAFVGLFFLLFVFLMAFAKSLENVSMKKVISAKQVREGDWLFYDLKIGGRKFEKDWDGLGEEDVIFIRKFNKKVVVKDGIPYAPSFLFALILYYFSDYLLGIVFS